MNTKGKLGVQLSILAKDLGFNLSDIAYDNLKKLEDRQKRGTLGGSGDKR